MNSSEEISKAANGNGKYNDREAGETIEPEKEKRLAKMKAVIAANSLGRIT